MTRSAPRGAGPAPPRRGVRRLAARCGEWFGTADGRAVGSLAVLPVVLFAVPALLGHPAITGDNLIQNVPLRALVGRQLAGGHLPLWNPYLWSGTPLLGGLNAGAFYPFTFLFAPLPPVGAFVVNLVGVYWAGALGMYALCRHYRLLPIASFVGALTYAFSGAMSGQLVHLGVVQGMGWMPLLVLSELRIADTVLRVGPVGGADGEDAARGSSPWPWVALLALVVGLEALTGEPRAMAETEVVGAAVAAWLVLRPYARSRVGLAARVRAIGLVILAGAWGVALAAAELAPGWAFIKTSQRAVETFHFFGSGSLRPAWSLLLLVPDLFGGAGHFGSVHYFNAYNLAEVTGYVGLLPAGGALALLVRSFGRGRAARASDWGMWLAMGAFGLLLAWGSFTPLGHLWAAIPLFGKTRLQSRNLEIVDLAMAVLFAFWADRALRSTPGAAPAPSAAPSAGSPAGLPAASPAAARRSSRSRRWEGAERWLPAVPAVAAVLLCACTLAVPGPVEETLHATSAGAALARGLWPWFLAQAGVAGAVVALVARWRALGTGSRRRALVAVVVADLAFFTLATATVVGLPGATPEPAPATATGVLGTTGRFAIVDTTVTHLAALSTIGQPDLNVFTRLPSVQGYGSIVSQRYGAETGTHALDTLSPCALGGGVFDALRLSTLVVSPGDLAVPVAPAGTSPRAPHASCSHAPRPGSARRRALYFGAPLALRAVTLVSAGATGTTRVRAPAVAVLSASGHLRRPAESVRPTPKGWSVRFARAETAAGIVVEGPAASEIAGSSTVQDAAGNRWTLDGELQAALDTSSWRFTGTFSGTFGVFRRTAPVRPPVWLADATPGSTVREVAAPASGGATDAVVARRPVTVVWSQSYLPGWHATLTPASARGGTTGRPESGTRSLTVRRHGLVQSVRVPAGTWTLTFGYRPGRLTLGIGASCVAVAGFVALFVATVLMATRRRRRRGGATLRGAHGASR